MYIKQLARITPIILLFLFSSYSFAEEYYWLLYSPNGIMSYQKFPDPGTACAALSLSAKPTNDPASFNCRDSSGWGTPMAFRQGTSCATGKTYNTTTGNCDCPAGTIAQGGQCVEDNPCSTKIGQSQSFTKSGSSGDGYGTVSGGFVAGVQSACFSGCAVSTVDQKCTGRVTGSYTCRGTAYYSGQTCATTGNSTEIQENTSQLPLPNPQTISEQKPCVYSQDGANQVCQSSVNNEKEGQFCGEYNGAKKCVDAKPTKNGIIIDTKVETENKPDGSKVVTKTDTATKTVCTGANQCNSTTTTTTTKTTFDANGNATGTSGSCTGEGCPDKNTNPDGDGDGFGDCTGDDCGEAEGGSPETPQLEEVDGYQQTTQKFYDRAKGSPLLSAVGNINAPTSGVAPTFQSDPIQALGGARADFGIIGQLVPNIDFLALVMKAVWCFIAVVVFLLA